MPKRRALRDGSLLANLRKDDVLQRILQIYSDQQGLMATGVLEIMAEGYGFLRQNGLRPAAGDVYVSQSQIRRFNLRTGDTVNGHVRPPKDGERYFGLVRVEKVNDLDPETSRSRTSFENLTPLFPRQADQTGDRPEQPHCQDDRPLLPHRAGPAGPHSFTPQGG